MRNNEVLNLSGITAYKDEVDQWYEKGEIFIFKYNRVYQLCFSPNIKGNFYLQEFEYLRKGKGELPWTKRGRFHNVGYKTANIFVGREIFTPIY